MPKIAHLVDNVTGERFNIGDTAKTSDGETVVITGFLPYDGMTGKVICIDSDEWENYWYPSVIGAHFEYSD